MRFRSCSAKCGVEAPMSWRTSSTVTSWPARRGWILGFAHGWRLGEGAFTGTISSSESSRDWSSTEIACSSPMTQPWLYTPRTGSRS